MARNGVKYETKSYKNYQKLGKNLIKMAEKCKKTIKNLEKWVKIDLKYEKKSSKSIAIQSKITKYCWK